MKGSRRASIIALTLSLIIVSLPLACAAPKEEVTPVREVVVGILTDLTGPASSLLGPASLGIKDYLDYVNEEKGGIKGKMGMVRVQPVMIDTAYNVARANEAWSRLKDMGMIIVTHQMGGMCDGLMGNYEADRIPLVAGSAGMRCAASDWVFCSAYANQASCLAAILLGAKQWLQETTGEKLTVAGTIAGDSPYTHLGLVGTDKWLEKEGITLHPEFLYVGTTDFTPALAKLKAAGCQFIVGNGPHPEMLATLKGMDLLGMDKARLGMSTWTTSQDTARLCGWDLIQKVKFSNWLTQENVVGEPIAEGHKLMKRINAKKHPGDTYAAGYAMGALQSMVVEEAIRLALDEVPPDELNGVTVREHGLLRIEKFEAMGLCHPITFTASARATGARHGAGHERFYEVRGEQVRPLTDWIKYPSLE